MTLIGPRGNLVAELQYEKETVFKVDYSEFENFIKHLFGHDYEFVADIECSNDTEHRFSTEGGLDDYDLERVNDFIKTGEGIYLAGKLIKYLYKMGYMDPGVYLISVSW